MSYRIHCDWCGVRIDSSDDQAIMPVTIKRKRGTRHEPWAEETKTTRHFCVAAEPEDLDRNGRDRMGLVPDADDAHSCYGRAVQAITGTELRDPGMGLEWRLVAVVRDDGSPLRPTPDRQVSVDEGLERVMAALPASYKYVLPRAGITSLSQLEELSDAEILALDRVGPAVLRVIRTLTSTAGETPEPAVAAARAWAHVAAGAERALEEPGLENEDRRDVAEIRDAVRELVVANGQPMVREGDAA
jgi:hypothetical protein